MDGAGVAARPDDECAHGKGLRARAAVQLCSHGTAEGTGDIELVTSELVTNTIRHARTPFTIAIQSDAAGVRVVVRDGNPDMGAPAPVDPTTVGGRGLQITQAFSEAWGIDQEQNGKSAWALFATA